MRMPSSCFKWTLRLTKWLQQDLNVLKLASARGKSIRLQQLGWVEGRFLLLVSIFRAINRRSRRSPDRICIDRYGLPSNRLRSTREDSRPPTRRSRHYRRPNDAGQIRENKMLVWHSCKFWYTDDTATHSRPSTWILPLRREY